METNNTNDASNERTFSQSELDKIVQKRLNEERTKLQRELDNSFAEREKDIKSREHSLMVREELSKAGLPDSLAIALNSADADTLLNSINVLKAYLDDKQDTGLKSKGRIVAPSNIGAIKSKSGDEIRNAFGLD